MDMPYKHNDAEPVTVTYSHLRKISEMSPVAAAYINANICQDLHTKRLSLIPGHVYKTQSGRRVLLQQCFGGYGLVTLDAGSEGSGNYSGPHSAKRLEELSRNVLVADLGSIHNMT